MILIFMLHALWAASVTTSKMLLEFTTPMFLTGVRMAIAGALLLYYQYFHAHAHFTFKRKDFWLFVQVAFFGIFFSYSLRHWALEEVSAAKTMFLYNAAPFMSALYSYFIFKERMSGKKWLGLFIGCVGIIPILMTTSPQEASLGEFLYISWPELAIFISAAGHSYSWIVIRQLVRDRNYSPMMVNGVCMFTGGVLSLASASVFEGCMSVSRENLVYFVLLLGFVIIISNIICHTLYAYLLRKYTATFLSFTGFMSPLIAALYGWILSGTVITWHYYVSSVVMLIGLYLFYKDELHTNDGVDEGIESELL